ncbi:MAG: sulfatase-like hydrolase/transferase, partial [Vicinamibacteria bacterium]
YQEMVHVPLIVKWPGKTPPKRVSRLVSQTDIFPTILEAAGLEAESDGVSLRDHPAGREVVLELTWDPLPDRPARMLVAFRGERYKYIAALEAPTVDDLYSAGIQKEELYDLIQDPGETTNLAGGEEALAKANRKKVLDYLDRARKLRATRKGQDVEIDEELRERLETLGYIGR